MRKQYNFWPGLVGRDAWDVDRLIRLSRDLSIRYVLLSEIPDIDTNYWELSDSSTIRDVAEHVDLVMAVETRFPIILSSSGRVMDGMHRVVRAMIEHRVGIDAVQFVSDPEPDFRNCDPKDLSYEEETS